MDAPLSIEMQEKLSPKWKRPKEGVSNKGHHIVGTHPETGAEASIPRLPYMRAVDGAGNVVAFVISTNRDLDGRDLAYQAQRLDALRKSGGFLYDETPPGVSAVDWPAKREEMILALRKKHASGNKGAFAKAEESAAVEAFTKTLAQEITRGMKSGDKESRK